MSKNLVGKSIPALLLGLLLTGCGGGGGSTAATTTPPASNSISLSGTAAVGFPIVGASVGVTCAAGPTITGIANTSITGAWSTTASGQTLPCVVNVTGGTTNGAVNTTTYQSIANGAGIVNVTPLTSLVVANLIGSSTATPTSAQLATITQAQIDTSIANVQTALGATLPSTINPITTAFTPTGGVVMDDVLTAMANAMTSSGTNYSALLSSSANAAPGAAITPPAGYSAALVTAYAGTASGSTGSGGSGTLPVAPTVGTPVVVGSANINLSWPAVSGATSYNVYRSTSPSVAITPANRVATSYASIVFMDTGLSAATTYYYKVTAINATGEGVGSVEVSAVTNAAAGADTSAPTGLTATVASNTQVNLSWNAVPGATQYIVYRSTTAGMAALLASNGVSITTSTTANLTGLSAATTYYFAVQSTTPGSVASAEVSATTSAAVVPTSSWPAPIGLRLPGPVSLDNVVKLIIDGGGRAITPLSYENPTFNVFRSTVSGFSIGAANKINATPVSSRIFTDTTVLASTQYFYKSTAVYTDGESIATPELSVTTNAALANRFTSATSIPGARKAHTATLLSDGRVLVAGGYGPGGWFNGIAGGSWNGELDSAVIYSPITNTWAVAGATGKMATYHSSHSATLLADGKVLVVGGSGNGMAELYDPVSNTWAAAGPANSPPVSIGDGHTATRLQSGKVVITGGVGGNNGSVASVVIFEPATNTWTTATSMINAREMHTATLLQDGKILVIGGTTDGGATYTATAELYDPVANSWSAAASMTKGRMSHFATLLQNGKVLVTHGHAGGVGTELYDPATNTWGVGVNALAARNTGVRLLGAGGTATLLVDGNVLLIGGNQSSFAELYQPTANVYSGASSTVGQRNGHTATLLQDGKVLVVGGENATAITANVDIYQ